MIRIARNKSQFFKGRESIGFCFRKHRFFRLEKVQDLFLHHQSDRGASKRSHLSAGGNHKCLPTITLELLSWAFVVGYLWQNVHHWNRVQDNSILPHANSDRKSPCDKLINSGTFFLSTCLKTGIAFFKFSIQFFKYYVIIISTFYQ